MCKKAIVKRSCVVILAIFYLSLGGCTTCCKPETSSGLRLEELREERNRLIKELNGGDSPTPHRPGRRERLVWEITVLRSLKDLTEDRGEKSEPPDAPVHLDLTEDPLRMTVMQRHYKAVDGSDGTVVMKLGDVTGGQVLVQVLGPSQESLMDRVSMEPGDVTNFTVKGRTYHLTLIRLKNFLVGRDFAVLEVSTERPAEDRLQRLRESTETGSEGKADKENSGSSE